MMKTRLNLTIDGELLKKVKVYAEQNNESISNLVEEYFETIVKKPKKQSLLDILDKLPKSKIDFPKGFDFVEEYYKANAKKYGF